ncbi:MAG: hypothetical protein HQ527_02210 [Cyanobacteria bacterium]|nr:hypothetical protein [Cyanobacteria bacterium bin.51]
MIPFIRNRSGPRSATRFDLQPHLEAASLDDVQLPDSSREPIQLRLSDGRRLPARRLVLAR